MVSAIHVSHTGVLFVFDVYDIRNGHWHGGAQFNAVPVDDFLIEKQNPFRME